MSHDVYVALAYGITAIVIAALILWVVLDQRARRTELSELEARGVRRRSALPPASGTDHGG
ncbi:heme exporter protein CcmD [Hoeflea sp. WL0058]|uniref:Heme exporter protein D n=1 Tax=Flavimaribacter sediminis TaxID=2865987 RepID=A0AAE2ZL56_9HYPH|nr:heme exporter protein CcmD [Flavimaribacter sediminis]MBW8638538.1 heme exporter protein CcmD [Flavimaribacter sediminis]